MIDLHRYTDILKAKNIYPNRGNYLFYTEQLFGAIDFKGKRVLEIGAGKGAFSCFFALSGASEVVALEPESDGSNPEMLRKFHSLIDESGVKNIVKLLPLTFQDYDNNGQLFDIIISHNSINHLDEPACVKLLESEEACGTYEGLFAKMNRMQASGGVMLIADCARNNLWGGLGIKTPITYAIDWKKHQQPGTWLKLMQGAGYREKRLRWNSINSLRSFGKIFLNNRISAFLLNSHFTLIAEKM